MSHQCWAAIVAIFFLSTVACESCKYEKFTPDHSACKPRNDSCKFVNNYVNIEGKALIVKLHNQYRERIAKGRDPILGPRNVVVPPSSNMREMEWDDELAYVAQKHVETCNAQNDCDECRKVDGFDVVGQNIYEASSTDFPNVWEEMMKEFRQSSYSQHSELIWADAWKIGCGKVEIGERGKRKALIVCNYAPGANHVDPPFKSGEPCTKCPAGTCCGDFCSDGGAVTPSLYEALCKLEKCKYEKFTPEHVGCLSRNPNCNIVDDELTKDEKNLILRLHNDYRERVTFGWQIDTKGVYRLSSGSNIRQLVWDDELAYLAQRHADTCNPNPYCDDCRKVDRFDYVAQRIYESSSTDFKNEVENMLNPKNFGELEEAQLCYAKTWRLGCGKVVYEEEGESKMIIICNFGPSLKPKVLLRQDVYYVYGSPCTECPAGTCCKKDCNTFGIYAEYQGLCKSNIVDTPGFNIELQRCRYRKFSLNHASCKPRNLNCKILNNYVSDSDKKFILNYLNYCRSVATANMMKMEWDEELAYLAQRHAETCSPEYDCYECRRVDRFAVHQIIYTSNSNTFPEEYRNMIETLLDDKDKYHELYRAELWRMGCGKVEFEEANLIRVLVVCNFGPDDVSIWKTLTYPYVEGRSCSLCPVGTCCGYNGCIKHGIVTKFHAELCESLYDSKWEPDEDFEILCSFSSPVESSPESTTDDLEPLVCRLSIIGESSTANLNITESEAFDFVECGFLSSEENTTVDSITCRLPSIGELSSTGTIDNITIVDFEFIKCNLSSIGELSTDEESTEGSGFVKCGISGAVELPAEPETEEDSQFFTCDLSSDEESSTSDTDLHPVKCRPGR